MAGKRQTTQSPYSFAFRRRSYSWRRCCSLRSGEVFPFRSCSNGSRSLASISVVAGSRRGFVCWAFGFVFRGGVLLELFRGGFPAGFVLVGGRPPALLGPGNGNVNSKVRPTARRGGDYAHRVLPAPAPDGSPPRAWGNLLPHYIPVSAIAIASLRPVSGNCLMPIVSSRHGDAVVNAPDVGSGDVGGPVPP